MKANKQRKIKVPKSGFKRSRFNWSHDVNTTFTWGEIQPTQCKLLIPNSKTTMQAQNLIRLAPMVAPTFGRVKYKTFSQFVPCADVFPNFDQMMAKEPITRNGVTMTPKFIPSVVLGQLSGYAFFGARANIYFADNEYQASLGNYKTRYRRIVNVDATSWQFDSLMTSLMSDLQSSHVFEVVENGINYSSSDGVLPHVKGFVNDADVDIYNGNGRVVWHPSFARSFLSDAYRIGSSEVALVYGITLSNRLVNTLFPIDRSLNKSMVPLAPILANTNETDKEVTLEGADYVVEFSIPKTGGEEGERWYLALAFELSDYGKRIRKILQGCGYQIDLSSTERVSILPLLAQYKAYFDVFGLQLYQGWETTACAGLIDYISNNFVTWIDGSANPSDNSRMFSLPQYQNLPSLNMTVQNSRFVDFMLGELCNEFYTEDPDFIGAHLDKLAVSPKVDPTGFISVDGFSGIKLDGANIAQAPLSNSLGNSEAQTPDYATPNGLESTNDAQLEITRNGQPHGFITQVNHGQVDADLLKRMYRWINRNTILGREIAKILRAQGLGKYVDECKSNYIGATDTLITISDVVSQAATSDAVLGEYGGKGLQYSSDKPLVFENDEFGYWITLATVVPEAGYTQGLDPTLKVLDKFNLYSPDFDAIGMELTTKDTVVGCRYGVPQKFSESDQIIAENRKGFGFIPRLSKFKVCQNLVNGDFNRHSRRNVYLPYTLDRQLNVNDFDVVNSRYLQESSWTDNSTGYATIKRSATTNAMPVAGNVWRMPTKYAWLGNFDRIFYNIGVHDSMEYNHVEDSVGSVGSSDTAPGFTDFNDDNFLSHGILDFQTYAPMKPIEDSYGLEDDKNPLEGVEFVSKS